MLDNIDNFRSEDRGLSAREKKYVRERTMKDILKTREKDCRHCIYVAGMGERGSVSNSICNYIGVTEEIRPCLPGKCREAGVFKPRDAKGRSKAKEGD